MQIPLFLWLNEYYLFSIKSLYAPHVKNKCTLNLAKKKKSSPDPSGTLTISAYSFSPWYLTCPFLFFQSVSLPLLLSLLLPVPVSLLPLFKPAAGQLTDW